MKYKVLYILTFVILTSFSTYAQRGIRIAYIDTEYILENVPNYIEANAQLDKKILEWKSEIDKKLNVISTKKQELEAERILLTKELYEERMEDIKIEENEVLDYQQKRFGPEGDLITQKNQLAQPIQDQIFATVQEIAESRNYDFIFDKSADLTMLFSAKQYDISELVLRSITRSTGRKQAQTKEERREAEDEELVPEINTSLEERQKALEEKKEARMKEAEARRQQQLEEREAAKEAAAARRQQIIDERAQARAAKLGSTGRNATEKDTTQAARQNKDSSKTPQELMEEQRAQKLKEREEKRQQALEARNITSPPAIDSKEDELLKKTATKDSISDDKAKTPQELMAEERAKKIKEREDKRQEILNAKNAQTNKANEKPSEKAKDSIANQKPLTAAEKIEAERQKKIEERAARQKVLEDRKKKILEDRRKEKEEAEKKKDTIKNN